MNYCTGCKIHLSHLSFTPFIFPLVNFFIETLRTFPPCLILFLFSSFNSLSLHLALCSTDRNWERRGSSFHHHSLLSSQTHVGRVYAHYERRVARRLKNVFFHFFHAKIISCGVLAWYMLSCEEMKEETVSIGNIIHIHHVRLCGFQEREIYFLSKAMP